MDFPQEIKQTIKEVLNSKFQISNEIEIEVEVPADNSHGDYSTNVAMKLAKELKKSPLEIAKDIVNKLDTSKFSKVEAVAPGFINFYVSSENYNHVVTDILEKKENYGQSEFGKGKKWLIEHTSPNPNKAMHMGHFRNNLLGMAIVRMYKSQGFEVISDFIENDRGIAITKLMWGYLNFARKNDSNPATLDYWFDHQDEWKTFEEENLKPEIFIDKLYVKASDSFKTNPESEEAARKMLIDWENSEPKTIALWKKVLGISYLGQKRVLDRLGTEIDNTWYESEIYKQGKNTVGEGLKKGAFTKLEDGAVLTNLKDQGVTDTIVIRKDGTSLYLTQDIALIKLKIEKFNPDKLIYVVGPDQSLSFQQLFAIAKKLELGDENKFLHLSYGYLTIDGKKMSSRAGTSVYIEDILDFAKEEIKKRITKDNLNPGEIENVSELVGVGGVKYAILKVGRNTGIDFSFEKSLSFEGDSGPYLIYTYARAKSIVNKAASALSDSTAVEYKDETEIILLKHLATFGSLVLTATLDFSPNLIATYLYELSQKFNKFYATCKVIDTDKITMSSRVKLVEATAQVLKNGLNLLGIQTVEKM